jgi:hypothetical protein
LKNRGLFKPCFFDITETIKNRGKPKPRFFEIALTVHVAYTAYAAALVVVTFGEFGSKTLCIHFYVFGKNAVKV